jgi:predicted RNA-binding protein with EMAP domain
MMVVALLASYLAPKRVIDEEQLQELRQITKEMEAEKGKDWVDTLLQMLDPED